MVGERHSLVSKESSLAPFSLGVIMGILLCSVLVVADCSPTLSHSSCFHPSGESCLMDMAAPHHCPLNSLSLITA